MDLHFKKAGCSGRYMVNTKKGRAYICVDRIEYAAGQGFCSRYNTVKKHMNMRMEEGEYTNDGK